MESEPVVMETIALCKYRRLGFAGGVSGTNEVRGGGGRWGGGEGGRREGCEMGGRGGIDYLLSYGRHSSFLLTVVRGCIPPFQRQPIYKINAA